MPSGTVSFATGETSKQITVNVSGDTVVEADEGFTTTLSAASAGSSISTATATGTIRSDDIDTRIINGTAGADTLTGTVDIDNIFGLAGNDSIDGGAGTDLLNGGAGDDVFSDVQGSNIVHGNDGNDRFLFVSQGVSQDLLFGDAGRDSFVLSAAKLIAPGANETDVVADFEFGAAGDVVDLRGLEAAFTGFVAGQDPFARGYLRVTSDPATPAIVRLEGDRTGAADGPGWTTLLVLRSATGDVPGQAGTPALHPDNFILSPAAPISIPAIPVIARPLAPVAPAYPTTTFTGVGSAPIKPVFGPIGQIVQPLITSTINDLIPSVRPLIVSITGTSPANSAAADQQATSILYGLEPRLGQATAPLPSPIINHSPVLNDLVNRLPSANELRSILTSKNLQDTVDLYNSVSNRTLDYLIKTAPGRAGSLAKRYFLNSQVLKAASDLPFARDFDTSAVGRSLGKLLDSADLRTADLRLLKPIGASLQFASAALNFAPALIDVARLYNSETPAEYQAALDTLFQDTTGLILTTLLPDVAGLAARAALGAAFGGPVTLVVGVIAAVTYYYYQDEIDAFALQVKDSLSRFGGDVSAQLSAVEDAVSQSLAHLETRLSNAADAVESLINDLVANVDSAWTTLGTILSDSAGQLQDWLEGLPTDLASALLDLAQSLASPIVLDLNGDGINLVSLAASRAFFDIDGDGFAERVGWVAPADAILAFDRNGNGRIDDISEVFGGNRADGFASLRLLDTNSNGRIDSGDAKWGNLLLWRDLDGDGKSGANELFTLAQQGVASISLANTRVSQFVQGNEITDLATWTATNGAVRTAADVWFAVNQRLSLDQRPVIAAEGVDLLPDLRGYGDVSSLRDQMSRDPQLMALVRTLAETPIQLVTTDQIRAIVFRWAEVDSIDPGSRGQYADAREVAFLEKYLAFDYLQDASTNPRIRAEKIVSDAFNTVLDAAKSRLLIQTSGNILFHGALNQFDFLADKLTISNNVYAVASAAAQAPTNSLESAFTYWSNVFSIFRAAGFDQPGALAPAEAGFQPLAAFGINETLQSLLPFRDSLQTGTDGNDRYSGTDGNDGYLGRGGNDRISGGRGADILQGGPGNDTIDGGGGADNIDAGEGDDLVLVLTESGNADAFVPGERLDGGPGIDTLLFNGNLDLAAIVARGASYVNFEILFLDNTTNVTISPAQLAGFQQIASNTGGFFSYLIGATAASYDLTGKIFAGDVIFQGSAGNDLITGSAGADRLAGGQGTDTIRAGSGDDTVYVYASDVVAGEVLDGGAGTDTLQLGAGINIAAATITGFETLLLEGTATIGAAQLNSFTTFSTISNNARALYAAAAGTYDLTGKTIGNITFIGSAGIDTITGTAGNDRLAGGGGADTIRAGNGDDFVYIEVGDVVAGEVLDGGVGLDTLQLAAGASIAAATTITGFETLLLAGNATIGAAQLNVTARL